MDWIVLSAVVVPPQSEFVAQRAPGHQQWISHLSSPNQCEIRAIYHHCWCHKHCRGGRASSTDNTVHATASVCAEVYLLGLAMMLGGLGKLLLEKRVCCAAGTWLVGGDDAGRKSCDLNDGNMDVRTVWWYLGGVVLCVICDICDVILSMVRYSFTKELDVLWGWVIQGSQLLGFNPYCSDFQLV